MHELISAISGCGYGWITSEKLFFRVRCFKHQQLRCLLILKVEPSLLAVVMYHAVFGHEVLVDNIRRKDIMQYVNSRAIAYCQWPIADWPLERLPKTDAQLDMHHREKFGTCVIHSTRSSRMRSAKSPYRASTISRTLSNVTSREIPLADPPVEL